MHKWMIPVAGLSGIALVMAAQGSVAATSAVIYGLGNIGLYCVSAAAHYKIWDVERLHFLFQLDHSMILIYIVASTTPIALVAIGGGTGIALLAGMVLMTGLGVAAVWLPFHPPRGFMNTLFFVVAWWPILFAKPLANGLGGVGLALLLLGGALYSVGALVVGSQRPDPNPDVFGYHEIWHIFVIAAGIVHYVLMWNIVSGNSPL